MRDRGDGEMWGGGNGVINSISNETLCERKMRSVFVEKTKTGN